MEDTREGLSTYFGRMDVVLRRHPPCEHKDISWEHSNAELSLSQPSRRQHATVSCICTILRHFMYTTSDSQLTWPFALHKECREALQRDRSSQSLGGEVDQREAVSRKV